MNILKNFLKGIAVGVATLIPGASGGTMAIIMGIYDDLIHAVGSFFENWKKHTFFLISVGLGVVSGVLLFSRLLENAITRYPHVMQFLFMGVIMGGLPVLVQKSLTSDKKGYSDFIFLILGFLIVLLMSYEPEAIINMATSRDILGMIFLFIAGIIIAIALVLPGISGSFMLLALGLYDVTLSAINSFNVYFLIPIGLGVVAGTLGTTKIIEKLLHRFPGKTYMLITGFVAGSLVSVFPGIPQGMLLVASVAAFFTGFLALFWLGKKGLVD